MAQYRSSVISTMVKNDIPAPVYATELAISSRTGLKFMRPYRILSTPTIVWETAALNISTTDSRTRSLFEFVWRSLCFMMTIKKLKFSRKMIGALASSITPRSNLFIASAYNIPDGPWMVIVSLLCILYILSIYGWWSFGAGHLWSWHCPVKDQMQLRIDITLDFLEPVPFNVITIICLCWYLAINGRRSILLFSCFSCK